MAVNMNPMNPQAEELNETIKKSSESVYSLLSDKGKAIFFPKKGILAQSAEAKGKRINATIGIALEEDGSPMRLKSIARRIKLKPEEIFPYSPSFGMKELREKWREMLYKKNPSLRKEVSIPIVTNAITHGLSITGYMFIDEKDKVILPDLFWGNYRLILANAYGAVFDTFETFKEEGFNVGGLKERLSGKSGENEAEGNKAEWNKAKENEAEDKESGNNEAKKKIVLLNFPNNPTGYTITEKEAVLIKDVILEEAEKGSRILVIMDDAYFGLVYKKGIYRESLFSELADLHENVLAIKLDGATKEDYAWGLRVGFVTYGIKGGNRELYEALENKTAGAVRGSISNDSHLSQSLLCHSLGEKSYWNEKKKKYNLLKKRLNEVERVLEEHKEYREEFTALPCNSGYFMCVKLKNKDGEKLRQRLLERYDSGVIAIGDILRIAFSSVKTESIKEIFGNIYRACRE